MKSVDFDFRIGIHERFISNVTGVAMDTPQQHIKRREETTVAEIQVNVIENKALRGDLQRSADSLQVKIVNV